MDGYFEITTLYLSHNISVLSCNVICIYQILEYIQCTPSEKPLLYHKLMTSKWIQDHAAISGLASATNEVMHFKVGTTNTRLLRIPIFQRGQVLKEDIVVYIKVYFRDPPTPDSDPLIGICDGTVCNAIITLERHNYPNTACNYGSFNSGPIRTNSQFTGNCGGIPITYTTYPNAVTLTFYPSEQLGTFHIIPDGGYTTVGSFTKKLDLTQGLFLEVYGDDVNEEYFLQYIQVEIKAN